MSEKKIRLVCMFGGDRTAPLAAARSGTGPITSFFGFYPFLDDTDLSITASILPEEASFFTYLRHMKEADVIFASYLSWLLVAGKIFFPRKTYIFYNIDLNSVILRSSRLKKYVIRFKLAFVTTIVCIARRQEEILITLGVPKKKMSFLPFGIDQAFFTREMKQYKDVSPQVFYAVGGDAARDYKTLLLAAAKLPEHQFVIECKEKNIPKDIPIPKNVTIQPMVTGKLKELVESYANARAVIIPSLDEKRNVGSDCCGQTVLLEALACRKPVVASQRSWIRDYFKEDDPIRIFEAENPHALVEVLRNTDFSSVVQPDFKLKYSSQHMTECWRKLFAELLT